MLEIHHYRTPAGLCGMKLMVATDGYGHTVSVDNMVFRWVKDGDADAEERFAKLAGLAKLYARFTIRTYYGTSNKLAFTKDAITSCKLADIFSASVYCDDIERLAAEAINRTADEYERRIGKFGKECDGVEDWVMEACLNHSTDE